MRARCLFARQCPFPISWRTLARPNAIPTAPQLVGKLIAGPSRRHREPSGTPGREGVGWAEMRKIAGVIESAVTMQQLFRWRLTGQN